jgi:hypothetical protein
MLLTIFLSIINITFSCLDLVAKYKCTLVTVIIITIIVITMLLLCYYY